MQSGSVNQEFQRVTAGGTVPRGRGPRGRAWKRRDLVFVADLGEVRDCCRAPAAQRAGVKRGSACRSWRGKVIGTMDFFATETLDLSQGTDGCAAERRSAGLHRSPEFTDRRTRATTVAADAQAVHDRDPENG